MAKRSEIPPLPWIRALARPYLKGYRSVAQRSGSLRGYWFVRGATRAPLGSKSSQTGRGFFVGYIVAGDGFDHLVAQPPECVVFAFVVPVGGAGHRRRVRAPGSLLRKTFDYIRWLTHRPPRFVFSEGALAAMTRHQTMREWPREKWEHLSRNFFIETLCWLVRSGLVKKL